MKTPHGLIVFFSSLFLCHTSSLYIGDHGHRRLEKSFERNDENSIGVEPQRPEIDLSKRINATGRRDNRIGKQVRLAGKQRSFINCVFKFHGDRMPEYTCDHSRDVLIKWHEEKGQLMGTITTSYRFPKQRSVTNEMQSPRYKASYKWKELIREKRRTIYSDETVAEEAPNKAGDQIDEDETIVPKVVRQAAADDTADESQVAEPPAEVDDENTASVVEVENDEGDENEKKEVSEDDTASGEGSSADKEIPDVGEAEKEVNGAEKEKDQADDVADKEVPAQGASQDNEGEKIEEATPTEDKNGDTMGDNDNGNGNGNGNDEDNGNGNDEDDEIDEDDDDDKEIDGSYFIVNIDLEQILQNEQIMSFVSSVGEIISSAGDYILSLILRNMKRRLHVQRINDRFDAKVEKLANKHGGNTDKAIRILQKRIHKRLGQNYEAHIIKFLKELRDGMMT